MTWPQYTETPLVRPLLARDAEAAGRYAVNVIRKPAKKWRDDDAALAAWCAKWAAHWANLAIGYAE